MLVTEEYMYAGKKITIGIEQPEFTSLCPMTGLPDFGTILITYVPDKCIVELKSLKYYLLQYRNAGIFYEHVVNRILEDLVAVTSPLWMQVAGKFTPRGGIRSTITAEYSSGQKGQDLT